MQNLASATHLAIKKLKLSAKALSSHEKYKFAYNLVHICTRSSAELYWGAFTQCQVC